MGRRTHRERVTEDSLERGHVKGVRVMTVLYGSGLQTYGKVKGNMTH